MAYETVSDTQHPNPTEPQRLETQDAVDTLDAEFQEDANELVDWEPRPSYPGRLAGWRNLLFGLVIGFAVAMVGARWSPPKKEAPPETPKITAASQTVTVASVESESIDRTLEATGTVYANDMLPVMPKATGLQIVQVLVDEGDYVEAGQVLAVLDDSILQTQIDRAQSQVTSANSTVAQAEAGVQQAQSTRAELEAAIVQAQAGILQAQAERDAAEAGVQQAQAAVQQARTGIEQAQAGVAQAQANLDRSKARLDQAQREFDRYQKLAEQGAISQQERDFRQTDVLTAEEDVRVAEANLAAAYTQVSNAEAAVANAEATVANAQSQVENAASRELNARANVESARAKLNSQDANIRASQANVDNARAGVQSNRASVAQIETQLEQTIVRAPQSGIIAKRMAQVGDVTSNSNKLFEMIRDAQLELHVQVPETQLPQVQPGDTVRITSDADAGIRVRGTVREIAPLIDAQTRMATVKVDLPNDDALRPGMFLRAAITTNSSSGLTIPAAAVLPQPDGGAIVYQLTAENTVKAQPVQVGQVTSQSSADLANAKVEVNSGLELGDRIVVKGAGYLKDGDRVRVSE